MRQLLERLVRGRVMKRHLSSEFGRRPIHISPDSALSYLRADWTAASGDLLNAAAQYTAENDNVWDVGANVGVFMLSAAHTSGPGGQVVAIEADSFLAALLQRTAAEEANSDLNLSIICAAAADEVCLSRFLIAARGRSSNALEKSGPRSQAGGVRSVQHVPTITLDSLLDSFDPPQVIKVDVEGAEEFVLAGAEHVLSSVRPRLYIEVGGQQRQGVTARLKSLGYRLFNGDSADAGELSECAFNTLAVHHESGREFDEQLLRRLTGQTHDAGVK